MDGAFDDMTLDDIDGVTPDGSGSDDACDGSDTASVAPKDGGYYGRRRYADGLTGRDLMYGNPERPYGRTHSTQLVCEATGETFPDAGTAASWCGSGPEDEVRAFYAACEATPGPDPVDAIDEILVRRGASCRATGETFPSVPEARRWCGRNVRDPLRKAYAACWGVKAERVGVRKGEPKGAPFVRQDTPAGVTGGADEVSLKGFSRVVVRFGEDGQFWRERVEGGHADVPLDASAAGDRPRSRGDRSEPVNFADIDEMLAGDLPDPLK